MTFVNGNGLDFQFSPFDYGTPTLYRDIPTGTSDVLRMGFDAGAELYILDDPRPWSGCNVSMALVPDHGEGESYLGNSDQPVAKVGHLQLPEIFKTIEDAERVFADMHPKTPWFFYITESDEPRLNEIYEKRLVRAGFCMHRLYYRGEGWFNALVRFPNDAQ